MPGRDFEAEFRQIVTPHEDVAVETAARDLTLRYFYWDVIHGRSQVLPEAHELIEAEVCHVHDLSRQQYSRALGKCLANIIEGVQVGGEVFSDG